jgi:hypothetical protein
MKTTRNLQKGKHLLTCTDCHAPVRRTCVRKGVIYRCKPCNAKFRVQTRKAQHKARRIPRKCCVCHELMTGAHQSRRYHEGRCAWLKRQQHAAAQAKRNSKGCGLRLWTEEQQKLLWTALEDLSYPTLTPGANRQAAWKRFLAELAALGPARKQNAVESRVSKQGLSEMLREQKAIVRLARKSEKPQVAQVSPVVRCKPLVVEEESSEWMHRPESRRPAFARRLQNGLGGCYSPSNAR